MNGPRLRLPVLDVELVGVMGGLPEGGGRFLVMGTLTLGERLGLSTALSRTSLGNVPKPSPLFRTDGGVCN